MREQTSEPMNPRSNFYHKKHLSNTFICTFIFSIKLFRKYKNIFTFLHPLSKPKNTFPASYLLYCIVIYFIAYHIYYTYIHTLCLATTRWSWGHKTRKLFYRLLDEERRELLRLFPESSI
jgi:hypothetical protein